MNRVLAAITLCISVFFIYNIIRHMINPGGNILFTRALMFSGLGTLPLVFIMGFAGGRDRWPHLIEIGREVVGPGPYAMIGVIGLGLVVIVLPLAIFAAILVVVELRSALIIALYFVPFFVKLFLAPSKTCIQTSVIQVFIFFGAIFISVGLIALLQRFSFTESVYIRHFHKIWPDYDDRSSLNMFFWIYIFALINQLIEFIFSILGLLGRSGISLNIHIERMQ